MKPPATGKYAFRVRTRRGIVMDVLLPGRNQMEAERKLRQIYLECEVIARSPLRGGGFPPNFADSAAAPAP
jgi:hypothetical protein